MFSILLFTPNGFNYPICFYGDQCIMLKTSPLYVCGQAISLLKMETFGVTIAIHVFTSTDVALFPPDVC